MSNEGQVLENKEVGKMEPMGFEPTTSCMPYMISAFKYLSFIPLYAFLRRKYRFHTGYKLAKYYNHTENTNKSDARMTPKIADIRLTTGRHTYVMQKNGWNQLGCKDKNYQEIRFSSRSPQ